jgi:hypothetical protein
VFVAHATLPGTDLLVVTRVRAGPAGVFRRAGAGPRT